MRNDLRNVSSQFPVVNFLLEHFLEVFYWCYCLCLCWMRSCYLKLNSYFFKNVSQWWCHFYFEKLIKYSDKSRCCFTTISIKTVFVRSRILQTEKFNFQQIQFINHLLKITRHLKSLRFEKKKLKLFNNSEGDPQDFFEIDLSDGKLSVSKHFIFI